MANNMMIAEGETLNELNIPQDIRDIIDSKLSEEINIDKEIVFAAIMDEITNMLEQGTVSANIRMDAIELYINQKIIENTNKLNLQE